MQEHRDAFDADDRQPAMPEWFVTFADMMSLLLALFVMMASFSEVQEVERFRALSDSLRGQFGQTAGAQNNLDALQMRDAQLAAEITPGRLRRASLLQLDLPATISDSQAGE